MKKPTRAINGYVPGGTTCPDCGKRQWHTKADAKAIARRMASRVGRLHPYRCGDYWHLGHIPPEVARGTIQRDAIENRRPR